MFSLGERLTKALAKFGGNDPQFSALQQSIKEIKDLIKTKKFQQALSKIESLKPPEGLQNRGQKVYLEQLLADYKGLSTTLCQNRAGIRTN